MTVVGRLEKLSADDGTISLVESDTSKRFEIALGDIVKARLEIEL